MLEIDHLLKTRREANPLAGMLFGAILAGLAILGLALSGCGSVTADDPPSSDGGAGAGGHAGAASGGRIGTSAGGGGQDGADAWAGAGGGASGAQAVPMLDCMATNAAILSAGIFCQNLLANCGAAQGLTLPAGYATQAACEVTYASATANARQCQGANLCWFVEGYDDAAVNSGDPAVFCPAAEGLGTCLGTT